MVLCAKFVGNDPPNMKDLNRHVVKRFASIWKDVGIELGLQLPVLKSIEQDYPKNVVCCFQETLDKWLRLYPGASWSILEIAITNVNRQDLHLNPVENLYGEDLHIHICTYDMLQLLITYIHFIFQSTQLCK